MLVIRKQQMDAMIAASNRPIVMPCAKTRARIRPPVLAANGNVLVAAERLDGKPFIAVDRIQLGGFIIEREFLWVSESGLLYFIPPSDQKGEFVELSVLSTGEIFELEEKVYYTADSLEAVRSLMRQMEVLRDASRLRVVEGRGRSEPPKEIRLRYDVIILDGHRRFAAALDAIDESGEPVTSGEAIASELQQLNNIRGQALDTFAAAEFSSQKTLPA
jgi:hypothetical protein